jgi:hypothetical protein
MLMPEQSAGNSTHFRLTAALAEDGKALSLLIEVRQVQGYQLSPAQPLRPEKAQDGAFLRTTMRPDWWLAVLNTGGFNGAPPGLQPRLVRDLNPQHIQDRDDPAGTHMVMLVTVSRVHARDLGKYLLAICQRMLVVVHQETRGRLLFLTSLEIHGLA